MASLKRGCRGSDRLPIEPRHCQPGLVKPGSKRAKLIALLAVFSILVVSCGTTGGETGSSTTDIDEGTHDHTEDSQSREWDGGPVPDLKANITVNAEGGYVLNIDAPGFTFTGADVFDPVPGEGHAHLFVDGDLRTMVYGPEFVLPLMEPGTYQVMVTLSTNDHLDYKADDEVIAVMFPLVVESSEGGATTTDQPEGPESVEVSVEVHGDMIHTEKELVVVPLGSTVVITVVSDIQDEVHIHGYDLFEHLHPGQKVTIEFEADVPGIFEVELETSKKLLVELQVG